MSGEPRSGARLLGRASIMHLPEVVAALPEEDRQRFDQLYQVVATVGELDPPASMAGWIERYFGSVEAVRRQKVVKVTNRLTLEEALFNELRARRPLEARIPADLGDEIAKTGPDPFCEPERNTPADPFGRIRGAHAITAGNIAKYDGLHSIIIFDEHHPLAFTEETVVDAVRLAQQWFAAAHQREPEAVYPLFMWNCLWKSGASIVHGHAQVSLTRGAHYGKVEQTRRATLAYREAYGAEYFDDLFRVHQSLGLGAAVGPIRVMASLVPLKEKEVILTAPVVDDDLARTASRALRCLVERLNMVSFNLVMWMPPLTDTGEDWSGMPVVVRLVDRGDPLNRTSDIGAMELYAASVVSSDPFRVAEVLWDALGVR